MNHRVPATNNVADTGPLDFNHFRAHVGEQAGGKWPGKHLLKSQDLDSIQRAWNFSCSTQLPHSLTLNFDRLELFDRKVQPCQRSSIPRRILPSLISGNKSAFGAWAFFQTITLRE